MSVNIMTKNGVVQVAGAGGSGNANIKEVTQEEYDALPESKESDGVVYAITDAEADVVESIGAEYEASKQKLKLYGAGIDLSDNYKEDGIYFNEEKLIELGESQVTFIGDVQVQDSTPFLSVRNNESNKATGLHISAAGDRGIYDQQIPGWVIKNTPSNHILVGNYDMSTMGDYVGLGQVRSSTTATTVTHTDVSNYKYIGILLFMNSDSGAYDFKIIPVSIWLAGKWKVIVSYYNGTTLYVSQAKCINNTSTELRNFSTAMDIYIYGIK